MSNSNVLIKKFKNGSVTLHSPLKYDKSVGDINNWIDTYYSDDMYMEDLSIWTDTDGDGGLYMVDTNKGKVYDMGQQGFNLYENVLVQLQEKLTRWKSLKFEPVGFDTWMEVYDRYLNE